MATHFFMVFTCVCTLGTSYRHVNDVRHDLLSSYTESSNNEETSTNRDHLSKNSTSGKCTNEKVTKAMLGLRHFDPAEQAECNYCFLRADSPAASCSPDLGSAADSQSCDPATPDHWAVVDAHLHSFPFGGDAQTLDDQMAWMRRAGVLFTMLNGIGQTLAPSDCTYYLDCPGTQMQATMDNDRKNREFIAGRGNREQLRDYLHALSNPKPGKKKGTADRPQWMTPWVDASMTGLDMHYPDRIVADVKELEEEIAIPFHWAGEVNLVKQALSINKNGLGLPVPVPKLRKLAPFMAEWQRRGAVLGVHCDIGITGDTRRHLGLLKTFLNMYPNNKIVWLHFGGMSRELNPDAKDQCTTANIVNQTMLCVEHHTDIIERLFVQHPLLSIDLAWDVLFQNCYNDPNKIKHYRDLMNRHPGRFIPGTDFVAALNKDEVGNYRRELCDDNHIYNGKRGPEFLKGGTAPSDAEDPDCRKSCHLNPGRSGCTHASGAACVRKQRDPDVFSDLAFQRVVLGQNYFDLLGLPFRAPPICA